MKQWFWLRLVFSYQRYFIFAGVKNRTVICKNCRNIFSGV